MPAIMSSPGFPNPYKYSVLVDLRMEFVCFPLNLEIIIDSKKSLVPPMMKKIPPIKKKNIPNSSKEIVSPVNII